MSPVADNPVIVPNRELEQDKKPRESEPPRIRCPLCGWSPRKEDQWFCECGHSWNTFDTGCPRHKRQNPTPATKDEAQLNCVALRPSLDYEVAWSAVKGQDEPPTTAPLTALHATGRSFVDVGGKKYGGPPRRP